MQILLDNLVLAGDGAEGARDLVVNGRVVVQEAQFLRAESVELFDRRNRSTLISFHAATLFDTMEDAEVYLLERAEKVQIQGLVTLIARTPSGAETRRYLSDAIVEISEGRQIGVTIEFSYTIRGGIILSAKP
jgi:hypothetical protein